MTFPTIVITFPRRLKPWLFALAGGTLIGFSFWFWKRWNRSRQLESFDTLTAIPPQKQRTEVSRTLTHLERSNTGSLSSKFSIKLPFMSGKPFSSSSHDIDDASQLDCGRLGLRTLAGVVEHLETLMNEVKRLEDKGVVDTSTDSGQLINELRLLLEQAYHLREEYRRKLILHEQEYVADDWLSEDDTCSYFSAMEQLDLSDLEIEINTNVSKPLYCKALKMIDLGEISYRSLRTQLVGCAQDFQYVAKLHCLREAFDFIFKQGGPYEWFTEVGKLTALRFLHCLGYSTSDFSEAYERLLDFIKAQRDSAQNTIFEELSLKGVKVLNFYDVVIDLMLLDAFELLADPPSSVLSVTRHRWLSDNFKRVALDSTIYTILLAKRKLLKYPDGFYAHYYTLLGTIVPALAWGFLGPDQNALRMCTRFRDTIMDMLCEAFICYDESSSVLLDQMDQSNLHSDNFPSTPVAPADWQSTVVAEFPDSSWDDATGQINGGDLMDDLDDTDDKSTVVEKASVESDVCNHTFMKPSPRRGLRYSNVSLLAEDLYHQVSRCLKKLTHMMLDEAKRCGNPIPHHWKNNPPLPALQDCELA